MCLHQIYIFVVEFHWRIYFLAFFSFVVYFCDSWKFVSVYVMIRVLMTITFTATIALKKNTYFLHIIMSILHNSNICWTWRSLASLVVHDLMSKSFTRQTLYRVTCTGMIIRRMFFCDWFVFKREYIFTLENSNIE